MQSVHEDHSVNPPSTTKGKKRHRKNKIIPLQDNDQDYIFRIIFDGRNNQKTYLGLADLAVGQEVVKQEEEVVRKEVW